MKHSFLVTIEGAMSQKEAQTFIQDIGGNQGSLPPEERVLMAVYVKPISQKPTLVFSRGHS